MNSSVSSLAFHRGISGVQADFALKILRALMWRKDSANLLSFVISPSCLSIVLSMVHGGALGETEQEIRKLLGDDVIAAQFHFYAHQLLQKLIDHKQNYALELANKIFVKKEFGVQNEFRLFVDTHFGQNHVELVDFSGHHGKNINNMLLVSAISFKGKWPFDFYSTCIHPMRFHISETLQKDIGMLHSIGTFKYLDNFDFQLLGIPFFDAELFLFILLPRQQFNLANLLAKLTGQMLLKIVDQCTEKEIYVNIPKFKLESEHYLKEALKSLGIVHAFGGRAQFGKITKNTLSNISISQNVQKAIFEIDEEGKEHVNASNCRSTNFVFKFIADHPFAFFVANGTCENIMMAGIFVGY
ncbi:hypothetical protein niasHT_000475 [Heterodera trifolii]|uniref:Serpin domain-containing protein n=1 Tax=Heterodera trifolii TaxID=157864 RepID=A0ABD2M0W9_9BILA